MATDLNDCTKRPHFLASLSSDAVRITKIATHPHFSPYKVYIDRSNRTVVILNPKVGSTSFRSIVTEAYTQQLGQKCVTKSVFRFVKKAQQFPIAQTKDYFHVFSHPDEYEFYTVVRNPYSRLKSAWNDKFAQGHQHGYPRSIRGRELQKMRRFARENQLEGAEKNSLIPFTTFVSQVESEKVGTRNHHWDEQFAVLMMDSVRYTRVFKIEDQFNDLIHLVLGRLGINDDLIEKATARPQNQSQKVNQPLYNADLAKRVQQIFSRDFNVLGYDVDSWQGQ